MIHKFENSRTLGKFTGEPQIPTLVNVLESAMKIREVIRGAAQPEELRAAYQRIDELTDALTAARHQIITLGGNEPDGCQIQQAVLSVIDAALS